MDEPALAGVVLLLIVPLVVFDGVAAVRAGFDAAFWRRPLDDKLDHVVGQPRTWQLMGAVWPPILVLACAGMAAFSIQLWDAGAGTWPFLALGAYLLGSFAWLLGVLVQMPAVLKAARVRAETGRKPDWLEGLWQTAWWSELTYVSAANVAFLAWGVGMLDADYPAGWMAWTMTVGGAVTVAGVAATRNAFPHLGVMLPIVLGVALVTSG